MSHYVAPQRLRLVCASLLAIGIPVVRELSAQEPTATSRAQASGLIGTWQGSLKSANRESRVVFKISRAGGQFKAVMYSIDHGGEGKPASAIVQDGSAIRITIAAIRGNYEGKLTRDGKNIVGTWTQGGPLPLNLARATAGTAWVIPDAASPPKSMVDAGAAFEVATIKPSQFDGVSLKLSAGGLFESAGTTLSDLIKLAYDLHPRQITGGPAWIQTEKYDVTSKPDKPGKPGLEQLKAMVRKLLADRFQLTFHVDKRELPVYAITVAKAGAKLIENDSDPNGLWGGEGVGPRSLGLKNITMAEFARVLMASILDRPAVDQTGLGPARYDFALRWTSDALQSQSGRTDRSADNANAPPDLFTAFEEQLGLKLESTKALVDVFVIDHAGKPSAN